jgi:predicted RNA-binding protein
MCQAAIYLDGEKIMEDVMLVEPVPEGVRLVKLFEPVRIVPVVIKKIDLIKNQILLNTIEVGGIENEGN